MPKTSNVFAHVEPELKEQAEQVFNMLGIPMSTAVSMFLRQVVLNRGIPFEIKLPNHPKNIADMTREQFDSAINAGLEDIKSGRVISADALEKKIMSKYGL